MHTCETAPTWLGMVASALPGHSHLLLGATLDVHPSCSGPARGVCIWRLSTGVVCSVWPVVAAIYGVIGIVMWGPLTQRDGYVITPRSALESLKRCWGAVSSSRAFLGGEYIASVPPKVGVLQFAANIIFWLFVLGCKVRLLGLPPGLCSSGRAW